MTKEKEETTTPRVGDKRNKSDRAVIKELLLSNHLHRGELTALKPVMA